MPDPFDYTSAFANVPSPGDAFLSGVKGGVDLKNLQVQQQQQRAATAQQQQKKAVLSSLISKGSSATADDYVQAGLQIPEMGEKFKQFWDMKNEAQQQNELQRISGWAAAIDSGQPKIASDAMRAQADAIENTTGSPTQESKGLRAKADQVDANPQSANVILKSMIAANPKGKDVITGLVALGGEQRAQELQGDLVRKGGADADAAVSGADSAKSKAVTDGVTARYAEQNALRDYEVKGWNIKKIQADIANDREANRIRAMEAAASREGNSLKREELGLKIEEAKRGRDEKVRERIAQGETEIAGVTDTKDLIDTILADEDSLRAVTGMGAWKGAIPGTVNRSMAGKIEQLVNMAAAMNLDKLKGPMSDKDILFVKRITANLDRYQDEDVFIADMKKFRGITERAEGKLRQKYGAPAPQPKTQPAASAVPSGWTVTER